MFKSFKRFAPFKPFYESSGSIVQPLNVSTAKGSSLNLYLTAWLADKKFVKEGDRGGSGSEWRRQAEGRTANRNSDSVWYHCVALSAISVF